MKFYLLWIPITIVYYTIFSWIAKQNNDIGGKWIWITFMFGALCPMWIIVSRYTKNILMDAMVYDCITFLTGVFTFMILGCGEKFTPFNWAGLILIITGFICIRI